MNKIMKIGDASFEWDTSYGKPLSLRGKQRGPLIFGVAEILLTKEETEGLYKFLQDIFKKNYLKEETMPVKKAAVKKKVVKTVKKPVAKKTLKKK